MTVESSSLSKMQSVDCISHENLLKPKNYGKYRLLLSDELHRFFTFNHNANALEYYCEIPYYLMKILARDGIFLTEQETLQCYFCKTEYIEKNAALVCIHHKCKSNELEINPANDRYESLRLYSYLKSALCGTLPSFELHKKGLYETKELVINATNYRYESHRLYSFLKSGWCGTMSPYELAKSGFYKIADIACSYDNVCCAFCRLQIRGWNKGDTADEEHKKYNPTCVFLTGKCVGNVNIGEELSANSVVNDDPMGAIHYAQNVTEKVDLKNEMCFNIRKISV